MTTTGVAASGSTTIEPKMIALYEAVLDELEIGVGTRLLDVGCGGGLFLRLAAQRGAMATGVGEVESLPDPDDSFDMVTGFDAFQRAADPVSVLREAVRVTRAGAGPIVIGAWGRPEQCEAAACVTAVGALLPSGGHDPFALSAPGALEAFCAHAGLTACGRREVPCVWSFPDDETLLKAFTSTGLAVRAIDSAGEDAVAEAVLDAVAPYRTIDAGYRLENKFTYVIARA